MRPHHDKFVALVDLEAFLASVEQALNPELKGRPVIIGGLPGERGIVICASYEARAKGVRFGMSLADAFRILPEAIFLKGDIKIYRDWWAQVCDILLGFTPEIEPVSMDEAYLGLVESGSKTIEIISHLIKDAINQALGINCRIGIGKSKLFAKIACEMARDRRSCGLDPIVIIKPEQQEKLLAELPISALPNLGSKTNIRMAELGVTTIGDLRKIPRSVLGDIFGKRGLEWRDYADGRDSRPLRLRRFPKTISRETTFAADSNDRRFLVGTLFYLLERVCLELRRRRLQAHRLAVKLRYVDFTSKDEAMTMDSLSDDETEMLPYLLVLFDRLYTGRVGIRHLGVIASRLAPAACQCSLFKSENERSRSLRQSLDWVRNHHGYHAVYFGRTLQLKDKFREVVDGYELRTPSLSL